MSCVIFFPFFLAGILSFEFPALGAEKYPVKPVTVIVPAEAGSGADLMFRKLYQKASTVLGQPIMIVNKSGAGGSMGLRELHDAKPDGYTLGAVTPIIVSNKLQGILPFDHADFAAIGTYYLTFPWIIGSKKTQQPFKTMEAAISFARANPGKVKLATSGVGYIYWITAMDFQQKTGLKFNVIPQPGTASFIVSQVAGGHADLGIGSMSAVKPLADGGVINILAFFGPKRAEGFDDVPTLKELFGYDVGIGTFGVIVGPQKLPKEIVDKLDRAFDAAVNDPEYQKFANENNYAPLYLPPDKVVRYLDEQREIYRSALREVGLLKEK